MQGCRGRHGQLPVGPVDGALAEGVGALGGALGLVEPAHRLVGLGEPVDDVRGVEHPRIGRPERRDRQLGPVPLQVGLGQPEGEIVVARLPGEPILERPEMARAEGVGVQGRHRLGRGHRHRREGDEAEEEEIEAQLHGPLRREAPRTVLPTSGTPGSSDHRTPRPALRLPAVDGVRASAKLAPCPRTRRACARRCSSPSP